MSNEQSKIKRSKRLLKDDNAVQKQYKIAKSNGKTTKEPHKYVKKHAMDCGRPHCYVCGNPRRSGHKDRLTAQEHRIYQDIDTVRNRRGNGI